jgi:hypothetical protein
MFHREPGDCHMGAITTTYPKGSAIALHQII